MGTFVIAWTIIDQTEGQDGWILAEFPFPFLLTETRPIITETRPLKNVAHEKWGTH